jgi:protein-S-isoprenylcysteine O-methyltransferase Ste14
LCRALVYSPAIRTVHEKHGGANVRVPPPLIFLSAIGVGVTVQHFEPISLGMPTAARAFVGTAIAVLGFACIVWAFRLFKRSGQDPAPWKPSPSLVGAGPYRFSRNPMYVGMTSVVVGLGLALGNLWMIGLGATALVVVHAIAVLPEERYLEEKFGDDYARFRSSVRRYL